MIKYTTAEVVFEEIPDEVTLAINISNCQNHCVGCHSPELRGDIGEELTMDKLKELISANGGITCVCFMGEGNDRQAIVKLAEYVKAEIELKTAIYLGIDYTPQEYLGKFDYIKTGPYIPECGPLNKETTNQRMVEYNLAKGLVPSWYSRDITHKFWKRG